ncbi:MAG TPA: hypothetical protein VJ832_16600 [Variovorax sp.]|jgi:hypothetical protein|nr:hypothetical protein [Variovorax sp.]
MDFKAAARTLRRMPTHTSTHPAHQHGDQGDEPDWPVRQPGKSAQPTPGDWLFSSFFLCMAVAALPLIGTRWTIGEGMASWHAIEDALLLALPVLVPLPFLFVACVVALAFHPASRTPAAFGFLCFAIAIGLAALHALIA